MRNLKQPHGPLEPQDIEELLPWYVTGRVSREEARGIEAALKTMPDLAQKLAAVQREREAVARGSEAVDPPPAENLQRLLRQVETTRQVRAPRGDTAAGGLRGLLARAPIWQAAFGLACAAIVLLALQFADPVPTDQLGATAGIQATESGALLLVTFQPEAPSRAVSTLISDLGATVVEGPRPGGVYVLRLPSADPQDVAEAMERLLTRKELVQSVLRGS